MRKDMTWKDLSEELAKNRGTHDLNEKVFACMQGTSWPLWGPYEEQMDNDPSQYDTDDVACATRMIVEIFSDWESNPKNVDIQMKYVDGNWDVGIGLDAASSARLSKGGKPTASFMHASGENPGLTLMKAAVNLRCDLQDARPTPADTPEP